MKIRQMTAALAIAACGTALTASAQVPTTTSPNTQQTSPTTTQQAQQDSLNRSRQGMESAQDKTQIRDEQVRRSNPEATQPNGQKQQPATGTRTQTQDRTTTTTTPNGTTVEQNRTRTQTQTPGQQPDQTRTQSRTITHPDGRVMTHDYEYYNNNIVVRDTTGRRYYIENERWMEVSDTTGIERRMTPEQQRMMKEGQQNKDMRPDNNQGQNKNQGQNQGNQGQHKGQDQNQQNQNQTPRSTTPPQGRP